MIYIYRRRDSNSARDLADAMTLNARRIRDLAAPHFGKGLRAGDHLVCWGERVAPIEGVSILNGGPLSTKFEDIGKLKAENVPTVEAALSPGAIDRIGPLQNRALTLGRLLNIDIENANWESFNRNIPTWLTLVPQLQDAIRNPGDSREWLPRSNAHVGGNDLLRSPHQPDFHVVKLNLAREFRIHSFNGKSIRAGEKVIRPTFEGQRSSWIRSWDAGWMIQYDGFSSTKPMRALAASACKALGLEFGAVDIGQDQAGKLIVLEVNRAPGLEGNTITTYAKAVEGWVKGVTSTEEGTT